MKSKQVNAKCSRSITINPMRSLHDEHINHASVKNNRSRREPEPLSDIPLCPSRRGDSIPFLGFDGYRRRARYQLAARISHSRRGIKGTSDGWSEPTKLLCHG